MKSWRSNINGIFCALAVACLCCACKTTEEKKAAKEETLIRVHLETVADNRGDQSEVPVYRQNPVMVNIDTKEILNNVDIIESSVVDVQGGFGIRIVFDDHGRRVLENITARNLGKRLVVCAVTPEVRWLGAPMIKRRLADGELVFTPDATRDEAERIVRGVNNMAIKVAKARKR